jgi:hypothetical protein
MITNVENYGYGKAVTRRICARNKGAQKSVEERICKPEHHLKWKSSANQLRLGEVVTSLKTPKLGTRQNKIKTRHTSAEK